jgi:uncharacterized membrane protein HdeD (DUF308 family)
MIDMQRMRIAGIVLMLGGALALLAPYWASIAVTLIVGWTFLFAGLINLWAALASSEDRVAHGVFAALGLLIGMGILVNPLAGLVSLTVLVGILFLLSGGVRLALAWMLRDRPGFWLVLISGALSVLLGGAIMANLGGAASSILGILLGLELIFAGFGLWMLARIGGR